MALLSISLSIPSSTSTMASFGAIISSSSSTSTSSSTSCCSSHGLLRRPYAVIALLPFSSTLRRFNHPLTQLQSHRRESHVVRMAPEEEKMTRRSPLDFPIEWERPKPGRRPDIFPQFSPMKTPLPPPLPSDPPEEDEEEDEENKEEEEGDPDKENPDNPDK